MGKAFVIVPKCNKDKFQGPYRGFGAKDMALERKNASAAATAAATSHYASPYSSMTSSELQAEYQSRTGQSRSWFCHSANGFPDSLSKQ